MAGRASFIVQNVCVDHQILAPACTPRCKFDDATSYKSIHTVTNKEYLEKMLKRAVKLLGERACPARGVKRLLHEIEQEMLSGKRNSRLARFQPFRNAKQPKS